MINFNYIYILLLIIIIVLLIYNTIYQFKFNKKFYRLKVQPFFYIKYIILILIFIIIFYIKDTDKSYTNNKVNYNYLFILDVSKSMKVEDIKNGNNFITRLDLSKKIIKNTIENNPNFNYGLIIFTTNGVYSIPFTSNLDYFINTLTHIDENNIFEQGNNFLSLIKLLKGFFNDKFIYKTTLLTDGGEKEDYDKNLILDFLKLNNFKIDNFNIIGIGSKNGGKILEGVDIFGKNIYKTYNGKEVISKLFKENIYNLSNLFSGNVYFIDNTSKIDSIISKNDFHKYYKNVFYNIIIIFYIIFLILYFFENNIYNLITKEGKKYL